jgi:hypothetical protein
MAPCISTKFSGRDALYSNAIQRILREEIGFDIEGTVCFNRTPYDILHTSRAGIYSTPHVRTIQCSV